MYDVVALGEILIDFTPYQAADAGAPVFRANPGGAPANVLAMLSKMGRKTAFIGKVGPDMFGKQLRAVLKELGIDDIGLTEAAFANTTLAFVQTDEHGERDFSFYRNPGADVMLKEEDVPEETVKNTRIFHFGTVSMTHAGVRQTTKFAVELAKKHGALISFDPNLRPPLWGAHLDSAAEAMDYGCAMCDILKIEREELAFLTGAQTLEEGLDYVKRTYPHIRLILITGGKDGSWAYHNGQVIHRPAFLTAATIDTTGAGDTFMGVCLDYLLSSGINGLTPEQLTEMLTAANAAASIVTTRMGAIRSMPGADEIARTISGK